jgi:hypothetical protein
VAETQLDDFWVSTVFLGFDHHFYSQGPPMLFEPLVFVDQDASTMLRCVAWEDAVYRHKNVVEEVGRVVEEIDGEMLDVSAKVKQTAAGE